MLLSLLRTPSSFENDRWGFARNQLGHGYIVGGAIGYFLGPLVLIGYAVWEYVQWRKYGGKLWDGVDDFANVLCVFLAGYHHDPSFLFVHLAYLVSGFLRRK